MKTSFVSIMVIAVAFTLASCAPVYFPCKDAVTAIEQMHLGNCVDQARRGQILFSRNHIVSRLVCGYCGTIGNPSAHCWNEVMAPDGKWYLIDLSDDSGWDGLPVESYRNYVPVAYWTGVPSVKDVQENKGAYWMTDHTVSECIGLLPFSFL